MAYALLVYQRAPAIKYADHLRPACVQVVFYHGLGGIEYRGYLAHFKFVDFFQEYAQLLFQRQRLRDAGKAECYVLFSLKLALRRCGTDVQGFFEKLPVAHCGFTCDISHVFNPAFLCPQIIFGEVGSDGEQPCLQGRFPTERGKFVCRSYISIMRNVFCILHTCGYS